MAAGGSARRVRYVIEPGAGVETSAVDEARARPADFPFGGLAARLAAGPARFALLALNAALGDPADDASVLWPAGRERAKLGMIEVTRPRAGQADERRPFFDLSNLPDGIEPSHDPLLPARSQAYGASIAHRTAVWHPRQPRGAGDVFRGGTGVRTMRRILLLAAPLVLASVVAAEARDPTPEMRARVEAALREQGFTAWDDIDVERDGRIEVDDARGADGQEYDLELDPQTLRVIKREED